MQTNGPTRIGYTILPDGKCSKNVNFIWMVPCTADTILSQNAALHFVWARMMRDIILLRNAALHFVWIRVQRDIILPRNAEQWTRAPRNGPAHRGMGPRTAEWVRMMRDIILPRNAEQLTRMMRDIILTRNAALHFVWARMMRDIILPRNAEQWTRAPRKHKSIMAIFFFKIIVYRY